mgnify:CR=1 FL=1|jgi:hypothetical protein
MFLFLRYIFFKLVELYNYIFKVYEFYIYKISFTYTHDGKTTYNSENSFWLNKAKYHVLDDSYSEYWDDVTNNYLTIGKIPKGISNTLYRIKYKYRNKRFICISPIPTIDFKKISNEQMKFRIPVKEVKLLDSDGIEKHVVTKKYMKVLGPNNNFHNILTPRIYDLFYLNDYEYLELTDILNKKSRFNKESNLAELLLLNKN